MNARTGERASKPSSMAEKLAEDDDDEGFGDFTFASYPNPTTHSNRINGRDDDNEDEWGDFINPSSPNQNFNEHPVRFELSSGLSLTQSAPNAYRTSANFDSFGGFSAKQPESVPSRVASAKNLWLKPRGALPLSIFGDVEEQEEEESGAVDPIIGDATNLFAPKRVDSVKNGSKMNVGVAIDDIIANLYTQTEQIKAANGSKLNLNGPNSNSNSNGLISDINGSDSNLNGLDSNLYNQTEQIKAANRSNMNLSGPNSNFNSNPNGLISNFNGSDSNLNGLNSSSNGSNSNFNGLDLTFNGLNSEFLDGNEDFEDDDGWEFKGADMETGGKDWNSKEQGVSELSGLKVESPNRAGEIQAGQENSEGVLHASGFGNGAYGSSVSFPISNGFADKPSELDIGLDFKPQTAAQNGFLLDSSTKRMQNTMENRLESYPLDANVDPDDSVWEFKDASLERIVGPDDSVWEFKDASSETRSKDEEEPKVADLSHAEVEVLTFDGETPGNEIRSENRKGALPLSLFSDGMLDTDDSLNLQDVFIYKPTSHPRNSSNSQRSNMPINDLISSLYSQAEWICSVDSTQKPAENGLDSTEKMLDSDLVNGDDDLDDYSWEFKDASSEISPGNTHKKSSTTLELNNYVDFYCKLKDELCFVALCHLDTLKNAKNIAALSSEEAKVGALDEEIQEAYKELEQEHILSEEVSSDNRPSRNISLNKFHEVLHEPQFIVLESEYHLSRRLALAEKDLKSAIELLKHAAAMLKILRLGSMEEQSSYVSTWSKMISACAQELKHGASIWKQSSQKNIHSQILSEPRGQKFILALGEIYRVVGVLGASTKLYKPWMLLDLVDCMGIFALLEECSTLWSSFGLEEALQSISDPIGFQYDGTIKALLESIKYIHDLDAISLQNHVFSQGEPICKMSLLTQEIVPDMKMVAWNGEHYFLANANLWANLISRDPPKLPQIHVG